VAGLSGFVAGAILFGLTYGQVYPAISGLANLGATYIPDLFKMNDWLTIFFLTLVSVFLFYVLEKKGDRKGGVA